MEKCEKWRSNGTSGNYDDVLTDVYHGQLWKDFQKFNGEDFLNSPRNYGLMLNFDYFQPMKHRKDYSVGVLYLVLLNLPRSERFKWENVIVVGIVPSMEHEPKNLNEFLRPAVAELLSSIVVHIVRYSSIEKVMWLERTQCRTWLLQM